MVATVIAEYENGPTQTAVVVSAVVDDDRGNERLAVIRTHLEDQHTRHDEDMIVFDEHHDALRAALSAAVLQVEPRAIRRSRPRPPDNVAAAGSVVDGPNSLLRGRPRPQPLLADLPAARVDARQAAGILFLAIGVVVLLLAIAFGSLSVIVAGIGVAGLLGYAGNRIAGA